MTEGVERWGINNSGKWGIIERPSQKLEIKSALDDAEERMIKCQAHFEDVIFNRPANPIAGSMFHDIAKDTIHYYDGTAWIATEPDPAPSTHGSLDAATLVKQLTTKPSVDNETLNSVIDGLAIDENTGKSLNELKTNYDDFDRAMGVIK